MRDLTFEKIRQDGLLLFEYVRGSKLYHTDTPDSDTDTGGVFISPPDFDFSIVEEVADERNDTKWWELGKFMKMAMSSNPAVLEAFFVPDDLVLYEHPLFKEIRKHGPEFVTKACFKPFGSYAVEQIKKARGQNKKIHWDIENMQRKTPLDFCYTFNGEQGSTNIQKWLENNGLRQDCCGLVNLANMPTCYLVYYDFAQHLKLSGRAMEDEIHDDTVFYHFAKSHFEQTGPIDDYELKFMTGIPLGDHCGIINNEGTSNTVRLCSTQKGETPICIMSYNADGYGSHCRKYKEYMEWKQKRNKARYESNMEGEKSGDPEMKYDCYLDEETEFLTNHGWKKYDDINDWDLIGCFNDSHCIEYKPFLSRIEKNYSGKLYRYENPYLKFAITENHKIYVSRIHRSPYNNFNTEYKKENASWELISVKNYFDGKKSYYHQLLHLNNDKQDFEKYSDDFISLLGMFLSEGSYIRNKKHKPIGISITQTNDRPGVKIMNSIKTIKLNHYCYNYEKRKKGDEHSWTTFDKSILNDILECGDCLASNKTIPMYVYKFSKRQFDIFLTAMLAGDGTHHKKKGHDVYYTSSESMAKHLHTLLILNGYNSQLYTYDYNDKNHTGTFRRKDGTTSKVFQVFISKIKTQYHVLQKCGRWTIENVQDKKVVCFETEYGTLVTRNGNKMCFHGNCKNLYHSFRNVATCTEIAMGKGLILDRSGIDRDFLMDVRNRKFRYSELMEKLQSMTYEMQKACDNSTIPEQIDPDMVSRLTIHTRRTFYEDYYKHYKNNNLCE